MGSHNTHAQPATSPSDWAEALQRGTAEGLNLLCRFVMGSNKVLRVALGHGKEDEYKGGLSALADDISGSIGLFFTRLPQDQVSIPLSYSHDSDPDVRSRGCCGQTSSITHAAQCRSSASNKFLQG